jgi:hypothetical protein
MASEAIRDRIAYKTTGTDPSRAEGIAGFGSRGAWSYKRRHFATSAGSGTSVSAMMTCIGEFARKRPDEITWPRQDRPAGNR